MLIRPNPRPKEVNVIRAYAAANQGAPLEPIQFDPGKLTDDHVELRVETCGICHSDLSMLDNEWGMTAYPLVPGHEVVGVVERVGPRVTTIAEGQRVGLGWFSGSCMTCRTCMSGDHNMCPSAEQTIVGRHGGFADRVRCHWSWAIPIPDGVDPADAGPLFCGGITVFNPIHQFGVNPTHRVGVVGIGGLGHMALRFLAAWGCHVTAFTSNPDKADQARALGAHAIADSRDPDAMQKLAGSMDFILNTTNVPLDWEAYLACLGPRGRLHHVGAVLEPMGFGSFPLIMGMKSVSGSPLGSPETTRKMLDFCARHSIAPVTEHFPMSKVNDALEHLRHGKPRFRIVLDADFD